MTSLRPENLLQKQALSRVVETFEAAYAGSPAEEYLESRGIGARTAAAHRIGWVDPQSPVEGWERFAGRICLPYLNFEKDPTWAKFRATPGMGNVKSKYAQQEGGRGRLFNVQALSAPGDTLCLAEGEMDVVTLTALGIPAVGVPGSKGWKPYMRRCLDGYRRVVLFWDDDENEAGKSLVRAVRQSMPDIIPISAPGGFNDIGEAYEAGMGDAIRRLAYGIEEEKGSSFDAYEHDGGPVRPAPAVEGAPGGDAAASGGGPAVDAEEGRPSGGFDGIADPDGPPPF